jgi:hypothetical protein
VIIQPYREYRVSYDTFKWESPILKVYLFYGYIPDNNLLDPNVNTIVQDEPSVDTAWKTYSVGFTSEDGQPYIGKRLGIRFFQTGEGWYWIDDVRVEFRSLAVARDPTPEDEATEVPKDANLSWSPGLWTQDVNGHEVYLGSTWAEVNSATTASNEWKGVQSPNEYDPGTMILGETYYWRIDEVNENYSPGPNEPPVPPDNRWKGDIWSFTVTGFAKNPKPTDGATDVPKNVILRWTAGAEALYHDVYFGTTESIVENATTDSNEYKDRLNLGTEQYDAGTNENTQVGQQYFWRIDEVNYMTLKGNVWDFTAANFMLVDDFDFYGNPTELRAVWKDSTVGLAGNAVVLVNNDSNFVVDGNSMLFEYWNTKSPYYSETTRTYSPAQDWSYAGNGVTELEIDWIGDSNNNPDPPMYVKLSDGSTTVQVNPADSGYGPNNVTSEYVQTWHIPLKDFSPVTLSSITKITLGIGDSKGEGAPPAEQGTLYFDDIMLQPPRCTPEFGPSSDFTGDCRVDMNDLRTFIAEWLKIGNWGPPSPVVEYLFEEGSGTTVANTGNFGSDYDLTIGLDDMGSPEPNNDPCWYSDADPCRGWTLWFDGEVGLHPGPDANGGDYLVIPAMNLNSNTVTITAWLKPDGPQEMGFTGLVHHTEAGGSEGCAGLTYAANQSFNYDGTIGYVWNDNDGDAWGFESGMVIPEQRWSMTALVVEPTQATLYIYDPCDTPPLSSATNTLAHNIEEFDGKTFIAGDSRGWDVRFFSGQMDDVRIYAFSLSKAQIQDVVNDIQLTGTMYYPLASDADLCVGDKDPCDPCAPIDDQVDLCDFSEFGDQWLLEELWPLP